MIKDTRRRFEEDVFEVMNIWHLNSDKKELLYREFQDAGFDLEFKVSYRNKKGVWSWAIKVPSNINFEIEPGDINIKRTVNFNSYMSNILYTNKQENPVYQMSLQQALILLDKNKI